MDMEIEGKDKTERYILAAKARARAALVRRLRLTALEKAMWIKLKRGEHAKTARRRKGSSRSKGQTTLRKGVDFCPLLPSDA